MCTKLGFEAKNLSRRVTASDLVAKDVRMLSAVCAASRSQCTALHEEFLGASQGAGIQ